MAHFSYLDVVAKLSVPEHRQFKQALEYAMEILALHMDFDWILDAFELLWDQVCTNELPQSAEALIRKKFLITHFEDDFCFRSYSFREKVFQFLNAVALFEIDERDPKQRDKILDRLTKNRESELAHVLGHFSRDESLRNMLGRRAALAHRISLRDIRELSQTQRYLEWLSWNPDLDALEERDEVDVAISSFQIDEVRN